MIVCRCNGSRCCGSGSDLVGLGKFLSTLDLFELQCTGLPSVFAGVNL